MIKHIHAKHYQPIKCYFIHFLAVCYGNSKIITIFVVNYNILSFGEQDIESILCLTLATGISYLCPRLLDKKRLLPPCLTRNGLAYMLFLLCNGMM